MLLKERKQYNYKIDFCTKLSFLCARKCIISGASNDCCRSFHLKLKFLFSIFLKYELFKSISVEHLTPALHFSDYYTHFISSATIDNFILTFR